MAQLISVVISFVMIRHKKLPFEFHRAYIKLVKGYAAIIFRIGTPIALQDFLVGISFLVMLAIVNRLGVTASAGVGVAEKVCVFIMLVPLAFMQSMTAFVAQNYGAGKMKRARKALKTGVAVSFAFGFVMFLLTFFRGDLLAGVFSHDTDTVKAAWDYLKAYAIDCLNTCFLFCFIGYYNDTRCFSYAEDRRRFAVPDRYVHTLFHGFTDNHVLCGVFLFQRQGQTAPRRRQGIAAI